MKSIFSSFLLLSTICIFCCSTTAVEKAKDYYFPYKNFFNETFYLYVNKNDTTDFNCWSMQTGIVGKDTLFSTIIYDKDNHLTESLTEKITDKESEMMSYRILNNNNRKILDYSECTVSENSIYKWQVASMESYKWAVSYVTGGTHVDFSKTRQYSGTTSTIKIGKKDYKCMLYKDNFSLTFAAEKNTPDKPILYSQESYYALNTGLVEYKLTLPDATVKDYVLKKISNTKPY